MDTSHDAVNLRKYCLIVAIRIAVTAILISSIAPATIIEQTPISNPVRYMGQIMSLTNAAPYLILLAGSALPCPKDFLLLKYSNLSLMVLLLFFNIIFTNQLVFFNLTIIIIN